MKTLVCACGTVRIGVPRRQQHCSVTCPYARAKVLAQLAKNRARRTAKAQRRTATLTLQEAEQIGYRRGFNAGSRSGYAKGFADALGERRPAHYHHARRGRAA